MGFLANTPGTSQPYGAVYSRRAGAGRQAVERCSPPFASSSLSFAFQTVDHVLADAVDPSPSTHPVPPWYVPNVSREALNEVHEYQASGATHDH